jgi:hypothetical protein
VQINRRPSPLRQRLVALAAAYAIALSGLIANFGGAQMAAAAAMGQPDFVICHNDGADAPAPSPDGGTSKTCIDDCCTGCLMLSAALPQPPATAIALLSSAGEPIAPLAAAVVISRPQFSSHRSRAPPLPA